MGKIIYQSVRVDPRHTWRLGLVMIFTGVDMMLGPTLPSSNKQLVTGELLGQYHFEKNGWSRCKYTNLIVWVKETTGGRKGSVEFWMGIPFLTNRYNTKESPCY